MISSAGRDDVAEGDAVDQRRLAYPGHRPDAAPPFDDPPGGLLEAEEADVLDQQLDAGQDDDLADRG